MNHYFINDPGLKHDRDGFDYHLGECNFNFTSDAGVFSKGHVDEASDLLIRHVQYPQGKLLDLGCGYGCIGIVLGKVYDLEVTFSDINERALELAELNAGANRVEAKIVCSDCFENIHDEYDVIVTNPPIRAGKQVMFRMYEGALGHLKENGSLYVVIQDKHGAASTVKKLEEIFGACETVYKKKGYRIFRGTRRA